MVSLWQYLKSLAQHNAMEIAVRSGGRGKELNIQQMESAAYGQVKDFWCFTGARVPGVKVGHHTRTTKRMKTEKMVPKEIIETYYDSTHETSHTIRSPDTT